MHCCQRWVGSAATAFTRQLYNIQQQRLYRYGRNVKRFYKQVSVGPANDAVKVTGFPSGYHVLLDGRPLRTPLGKSLTVPHSGIADRLAQEWDNQKDKIIFEKMHATTLVNTLLDNPVNHNVTSLIDTIVDVLQMDTLSFRMDTPPELSAFQSANWDPILEWFAQRFGIRLRTTNDLVATWDVRKDNDLSQLVAYLRSGGTSTKPREVPQQEIAAAEQRAEWYLVPLVYASECVKSSVLSCALVDGRLNLEEVIRQSQLEREYQLKYWQRVDWHHDVTDADLRERLIICHELCNNIHKLFESV